MEPLYLYAAWLLGPPPPPPWPLCHYAAVPYVLSSPSPCSLVSIAHTPWPVCTEPSLYAPTPWLLWFYTPQPLCPLFRLSVSKELGLYARHGLSVSMEPSFYASPMASLCRSFSMTSVVSDSRQVRIYVPQPLSLYVAETLCSLSFLSLDLRGPLHPCCPWPFFASISIAALTPTPTPCLSVSMQLSF